MEQTEIKNKKSKTSKFIINLGLLVAGIAMAFSGMLIQICYHMGNHGGINTLTLIYGIDYFGWSDIHKISIILLSLFMIFHFILHWKWYKTIIKKKLMGKNKQVIILTVLFILVALTGYIPWFVQLSGSSELIRKGFIEIHDKLTLILLIFLILHIIKRLKWYVHIIWPKKHIDIQKTQETK